MWTVTTFALVPGAGGAAWYWHRVVPLIEEAGHEAVAVELPADDPDAGLPEYADLVTSAVEGRDDVVVVGQSMGGFTVPMVAVRRPVAGLVLLNAMLPLPGETAGAWWDAVGSEDARVAAARAGGYPEESTSTPTSSTTSTRRSPRAARRTSDPRSTAPSRRRATSCSWPDVPTRVVAGAGDRFFPVALQRRVARERLGLDLDTVPGGHLAALSHPAELTAYLLAER